jgi:hypothetical protein
MTDFEWKTLETERDQLKNKLKIAIEALESIAAIHLGLHELRMLGPDIAYTDSEIARLALKEIEALK